MAHHHPKEPSQVKSELRRKSTASPIPAAPMDGTQRTSNANCRNEVPTETQARQGERRDPTNSFSAFSSHDCFSFANRKVNEPLSASRENTDLPTCIVAHSRDTAMRSFGAFLHVQLIRVIIQRTSATLRDDDQVSRLRASRNRLTNHDPT